MMIYKYFEESLNIEYEEYKKYNYSNFGDAGRQLSGKFMFTSSELYTYEVLLNKTLVYYKDIIHICRDEENEKKIKEQRKKLNDFNSVNLNIYKKMYWVIQDCIYYSLSRLKPEMHKINLLFSSHFYRVQKSKTNLPHKRIYDYTFTPSSAWFRDTLRDYVLKHHKEIECSAIFYVFLYENNLTNFGKDHICNILDILDERLEDFRSLHKISLIKYYFNSYKKHNFDNMQKFKKKIGELLRDSENELRNEKNLPKVGEGWIQETNLYYLIKEKYPTLEVIQHGHPPFLGRQHYDIWIPSKKIAIEYQGAQHYTPIDYFGGEVAFEAQKERDIKKERLSKENSVSLITVGEGYDIDEIYKLIKCSDST